ncbi:MAG: hypothetical protein HGA25_08710, partial [Clostridiales bacterium]|nr:hypothetical protein [Clostridiales bacterium]
MLAIIASCSSSPLDEATTSTNDTVIVRVINPEFFITGNDTIKNGSDLLWNFSLREFGSGTNWRAWVDLNPVLQEPGRVWKDPFTNRWIALVKKGEVFKNPQPVYFTAPSKEIVTLNKVEIFRTPTYWPILLVILLVGYLIVFLLTRKTHMKELEEKEDAARENEEAISRLKFEMKKMENQLPVKAPAIADEKWLSDNNPVGNSIPVDSKDVPALASNAITITYGKKPDLIVQARVSTAKNAVNMKFSHDREATTGLTDVVVYLGWNWDLEKKRWTEVGMLAGPCSNGFEATPGKVRKSSIFVKTSLFL